MPVVSDPPRREIVLIGGQIACGKTSTAGGLGRRGAAGLVQVRVALQRILGGADWDRRKLQAEGADLDRRTNGRWLLEYVQSVSDSGGRWVVDAARTRRQVEPILNTETSSRLIYLSASEASRRYRFGLAQAEDPVKRSMSFDGAMAHSTESEALTLAAMASFVIDTDELTVEDVVDETLGFLGWR